MIHEVHDDLKDMLVDVMQKPGLLARASLFGCRQAQLGHELEFVAQVGRSRHHDVAVCRYDVHAVQRGGGRIRESEVNVGKIPLGELLVEFARVLLERVLHCSGAVVV
jgi:hypothetical protein